jgi:hypothetical protein
MFTGPSRSQLYSCPARYFSHNGTAAKRMPTPPPMTYTISAMLATTIILQGNGSVVLEYGFSTRLTISSDSAAFFD